MGMPGLMGFVMADRIEVSCDEMVIKAYEATQRRSTPNRAKVAASLGEPSCDATENLENLSDASCEDIEDLACDNLASVDPIP